MGSELQSSELHKDIFKASSSLLGTPFVHRDPDEYRVLLGGILISSV